ncbi:unnamed protein product (macronuclear) [Paramecium tetraurelia]|uniref:Palmitoyltransferase n=1 Tax=Paramecium tetraurelia TaxID=5888 RepID=A0CBA5_PARTE|nr:uncharacterized protein GSPATT00036855001 [Paramecium tetraurelia]CAK68072.1 unnamed protein product [Paramecium tetraurelia]|eukprot:XP_001435469.1 hypothetical protein (macronuclear) [Paramecium tetraurelia strain d4-2]
MEGILLFILFALTTGSFMYMLVCTDSNSKTPMGMIRRKIYANGPSITKKLLGDKIFVKLQQFYNYVFYTNNRLGQISYFLIFWVAFGLYGKFGLLKHFGNTPYVSHIHSVCGSLIFIFCNYFFYRTCTTSPGIITKENNDEYVKQFEQYYDEVQYKQNTSCSTCNIIKPARSKHCRICNVCVSRFDHHCIWVRQCIGQKNYKYFLLFLFTHIFLSLYGVVAGILCLFGIAQKQQLFKLTYKNAVTGEIHPATFFRVFTVITNRETFFVFIIFVCLIFFVTLTAFFLYHLNMIRKDLTTNERIRKNDFEKSFLNEMYELQEQQKRKKDDDSIKRLAQLKQCWNSLSKRRVQGLYEGLRIVYSQPN